MAIIGEIIKSAVEVADAFIGKPNAAEAQKNVLRELLSKAEQTEFGKHYQFDKINNNSDPRRNFAHAVPYHSYDELREQWWQRVIDGEPNVTWPGKVDYFAVSSGTTSTKKHIPVTEDMLHAIQQGGLHQIKGIADFDLPADFFETEILMFGSSTDLKKVNGHLEGEISGISASRIPFWFEGFYRPGLEIASINDWDERVLALAKEAPNWNIGAISGIPSWIELMIKKVIAYHDVDTIHDIWPNFRVFTSGGVAFDPYRKGFERITAKPITVIDTYLASEGYIATQIRKDTDAMALMVNNGIYFEFVPFLPENMDEKGSVRQGVRALTIEEVEPNVDYVLIISTVSGAWRYMIGDTISFTDVERAEIKITGRTKHFLNVVGSQLSVIQMNRAIDELCDDLECSIKEFTVAAIEENDEYIHRWYLGIDDEMVDRLSNTEIASKLDNLLRESNKNYNVARNKALKKVEVRTVPASMFQKWSESTKKKGGQVKVARVMKEDAFQEWESFVESV